MPCQTILEFGITGTKRKGLAIWVIANQKDFINWIAPLEKRQRRSIELYFKVNGMPITLAMRPVKNAFQNKTIEIPNKRYASLVLFISSISF